MLSLLELLKSDAQVHRALRTFFQAFLGVLSTKLLTGYPPSWGAAWAAAAIAGGIALCMPKTETTNDGGANNLT